ncbi:DUF6056 family protein [Paenibacillus sp. P96]|uniref:DUF6056 family protein n=1 Tax=Paenibacillus zeirhizosphaerae TaxID=2987519 RepID=A0ABT9FPG3_9BACL|nr:DUF6056 family protein [Paenibacillus sp. P96]MDP4096515.1 DUF6056 family protein [Paenibacillus sp. P96]
MKIELKVDEKILNVPRLLVILLSLFLFVYMLKMNFFVPLWNDEFAYSFIFRSDQKIASIVDIIQSQQILYNNWTGRVLVHFLVQFFLWQGKDIFNIVNAALYVSLIFVICSYTKIRKFNTMEDLRMFLTVSILCWFFLPVMGQTTFWVAGSVNYLWAALALLFFLLPYRYILENKKIIKDRWYTIISMFFLGIFTGWSQENASVIGVAFVGICLLSLFKQRIKIPFWFISGFLGCIIGFAYLVLAPGNGARKKVMYFDLSLKDQILNFFKSIIFLLYEQKYLFLLLIIAFIFYFLKKYIFSKLSFWLSLMIVFTGLLSYAAMIASPEFPIRATFAGVTMFLIALTFLLPVTAKKIDIIILILLIPLSFSMYKTYSQYHTVHQETQKRLEIVNKSIAEGNYDVKLPEYSVKGNDRVFIFDVTLNPSYTSNQHFAQYYGLNSVAIDKPTMMVELAEPTENHFQLYYDIGQGIREQDSSKAAIYNLVDGNKLYFGLPNKPIYKFRFDPGIMKADIKIKKIIISNTDETITYGAPELIKMFQPVHDIENIKLKDDTLIISSIGYDPQVEFVNDYTQSVKFKVEFEKPQSGNFQVFYDTGNGFNEGQSVIKNLIGSQVFEVSLPVKELNSFRFDLGEEINKRIGIRNIIIEEQNNEIITLNGPDLENRVSNLTQVKVDNKRREVLSLETTGNDPSFTVTNLLSE